MVRLSPFLAAYVLDPILSWLVSDWLCLMLINAILEADAMSTLHGLTPWIQSNAI